VSKKQCKSQISYLNEKGKSRLGSRIRLMQAKEFFKEIDEKMLLWGDYLKKSEKVFISAPVALKNFLFKSNDEVRKLLGDIDLKPLSFSVKTPCHKELIRSGYILESAYLNVLTKDEEEKEFLYKSLYDLLF
jgi:hypothetical protein